MSKKFKKMLRLTKINLEMSGILKKFIVCLMVFSYVFYKFTRSLKMYKIASGYDINFWDGIFRLTTYPSLVVYLYFPIMIVITSNLYKKGQYANYIAIRSREKGILKGSRLLASIITCILSTAAIFLVIIFISYAYFGYSSSWSSISQNLQESIKLVGRFYVSNFTLELTPMKALLVSFLEITTTAAVLVTLRDVLQSLINKRHLANLIVFMWIAISIITVSFDLKEGFFELGNYIGVHTCSILFFHRFKHFSFAKVTIGQSLIINFCTLAVLILVDLIIWRKLVRDYD